MEYNMREVYESYTRDMRFYAYTNTAIGGQSYIMLGHNKDDCIENILTNTASQSHYENLCGMTDYSTQYHYGQPLTVLRPLLATMKQDIYTFAEEANIPFLVDSTPKWSQRGKIRDIVRPALESWNPLIIPR
jgi:tRNA(Ile)-lysidine synthase TilS/MesJ